MFFVTLYSVFCSDPNSLRGVPSLVRENEDLRKALTQAQEQHHVASHKLDELTKVSDELYYGRQSLNNQVSVLKGTVHTKEAEIRSLKRSVADMRDVIRKEFGFTDEQWNCYFGLRADQQREENSLLEGEVVTLKRKLEETATLSTKQVATAEWRQEHAQWLLREKEQLSEREGITHLNRKRELDNLVKENAELKSQLDAAKSLDGNKRFRSAPGLP